MRLLLDTHTFLWFVNDDASLSYKARQLIEDISNERLLSIASLWEIAIKLSIGKLNLSPSFEIFITEQLRQNYINLLEITIEHLAEVTNLPFHHKDPFDRLMIAQSRVEKIPLVSVDPIFDSYAITRLW